MIYLKIIAAILALMAFLVAGALLSIEYERHAFIIGWMSSWAATCVLCAILPTLKKGEE